MELRVLRSGERTPGQPTSGMVRDQAFAREGMWVGSVRTQPGMVSGWHHHGEHETYLYLVRGRAQFETAQVRWMRVPVTSSSYRPG
jgi:uncharacterized RmlC-like cupin family protein